MRPEAVQAADRYNLGNDLSHPARQTGCAPPQHPNTVPHSAGDGGHAGYRCVTWVKPCFKALLHGLIIRVAVADGGDDAACFQLVAQRHRAINSAQWTAQHMAVAAAQVHIVLFFRGDEVFRLSAPACAAKYGPSDGSPPDAAYSLFPAKERLVIFKKAEKLIIGGGWASSGRWWLCRAPDARAAQGISSGLTIHKIVVAAAVGEDPWPDRGHSLAVSVLAQPAPREQAARRRQSPVPNEQITVYRFRFQNDFNVFNDERAHLDTSFLLIVAYYF